jgi:hypothetical protein
MSHSANNLIVQARNFACAHPVLSVSLVSVTTGYYALLKYLEKQQIIPAICPFKMLTGFPCPGCGMTRACWCLLKLDFAGAFYYHPLSFLLASVVIFVVLNEVAELWFHKKMSYRWFNVNKWMIISIISLLTFANWMWSMSKGI